jgi:hypothetical protein
VKVIDLEHPVGCDLKIRSEATPLLASGVSDVVAIGADKREPAQCHISVCAPMELAGFANPVMESQFVRDEARLMILGLLPFDAQHFLEGDDVSVDLPKDLCDSSNLNPPIKTTSFMDVVGGDP